jgi:hypothetical protein
VHDLFSDPDISFFLCHHIHYVQRITIPEILENPWFKIGYSPPEFAEDSTSTLDDVDAVFNESAVSLAI